MFALDRDYLESIGLNGIPPERMNALLRATHDELQLRVGLRISQVMTNDQLAEFEAAIDSHDDKRALALLEQHVPNYREFVSHEIDTVTRELRDRASSIRIALTSAEGRHDAA